MSDISIKHITETLREEIAIICGIEQEAVALDKSIATNGINSLGFVELLLAVEKHFQVKLMENALSSSDISSVYALAEKIAGLVNQN